MKKINIFLISTLFMAGCQGYTSGKSPSGSTIPNLVASSESPKKLLSVNSLLVAPVEADTSVQANIPPNIDMNSMLSDAIRSEVQIRIVHVKDLKKLRPSTDYLNEAKRLGLDGVLFTKLNQFTKREGSAIGSANPARVDLAMEIIKTDNLIPVWQSNYHFKDQALTDNLFKIKERFADKQPQFRSAEDLLNEGYHSALKDFSQKRLAEFTR